MTPIPHFPLLSKKKEKRRKKMFKSAIRLTNSLIRKFRDIKLIDNDDQCLPPKKRKLTENLNHVDSGVHSIFNCLMLDFSLDFGDENKDITAHNISVLEPTSLDLPNSEKTVCPKRFNLFRKAPRIRIRSSLRISLSEEVRHEVTVQQLLSLFHNCVNFIQPRGHDAIEDIDWVVRSFSYFGKVLSIQDHWIQQRGSLNRYPSEWVGAMVTYRNEESCHHALNALSIANTSLICVSVVDHLARIDQVEASWTSQGRPCKARGTCIVVEGIGARELRPKFVKEFARYGTILDVRWKDGRSFQNSAEVTYKSTVSGVAAALGLDGKSVLRCHLRVKIKMSEKELFIHRKLRETF